MKYVARILMSAVVLAGAAVLALAGSVFMACALVAFVVLTTCAAFSTEKGERRQPTECS